MPRSRLGAIVAIAAIPCALAGCHKHRSGPSLDVGGFAIADAEPVRLDQILAFPLAAPIDPATVSERSARITAVAGGGLGVAARGTWRVRAGTIEFVPELPLGEPVATSGGLQPDTTYEVEFLGGDHPLALRTVDGRWLDRSPHTTFRTRSGSTPGELFGSEPLAPPRLAELEFTPRDENGRWQLGGGQPATLLLGFDRPLDPSIANLPRHPTAATPGPIALDYDDFAWGSPTRIAIDVELLQNTVDGATVRV
ncbi:MAG: hypothetical protein KDE27_08115, partial [Planctomycetes bacterium]|nr:hypothetical protein [Planctomycetota bacterium]